MRRTVFLAYGVICYAIFFLTFLYLIGFLNNLFVPKTIDSGGEGSLGWALTINSVLLAMFGLQHSVMARPGFKKGWTKLVPLPIERSTYVLLSSLLIIFVFWQWVPMTSYLFKIESPTLVWTLKGLNLVGYLIVLYASFLIDHFDLFGLRQVFCYFKGQKYTHKPFGTPGLYKYMRHPLYLGWILTFWATPEMSYGRIFFAGVWTAYIFFAIVFEERDLLKSFGEDYRRWQQRTPMILPWPVRGGGEDTQ